MKVSAKPCVHWPMIRRCGAGFPFGGDGAHWDMFFDLRLSQQQNESWHVYAVRDLESGQLVGQTGFLNISPPNFRLEIGGTWYTPSAQGTKVNPSAKLLLLETAFAAGAKRVELRTDARNLKSRAAITKLGAVEEGILRSHISLWDGFQRDSVQFSILPNEWPTVRAKLLLRLAQ